MSIVPVAHSVNQTRIVLIALLIAVVAIESSILQSLGNELILLGSPLAVVSVSPIVGTLIYLLGVDYEAVEVLHALVSLLEGYLHGIGSILLSGTSHFHLNRLVVLASLDFDCRQSHLRHFIALNRLSLELDRSSLLGQMAQQSDLKGHISHLRIGHDRVGKVDGSSHVVSRIVVEVVSVRLTTKQCRVFLTARSHERTYCHQSQYVCFIDT